jgi:hypothetical protein
MMLKIVAGLAAYLPINAALSTLATINMRVSACAVRNLFSNASSFVNQRLKLFTKLYLAWLD